MSQNMQQICPWCQMEIIWDAELGPENECPHCLNELGQYRTIPLGDPLNKAAVRMEHEEDEEDNDDQDTDVDLDEEDGMDELDDYDVIMAPLDSYGERVMQCLDTQIETPECFRCQEIMLFSGIQKVESSAFIPEIPAALGVPFLRAPFELHLYVCPSCFKSEAML
ncbi:MAG: hypothetical protein JWM44_3121, partial [Bacilli bacterium]|nr:hypothetical protein [Bacilli bacterium]